MLQYYIMSSIYEVVIGLEVHAELNTKTKMFCACLNDPNERHPNIHVCPICMGHPGTLPVANKEAIKKIVLVGLALHGEIAEFSQFDRKQYFYPDLPKGYQISQYKHPIVQGGVLELPKLNRTVRITRIHLEEDAGRLLHSKDGSLVDYNRAGVPLMELVTEPDVRSSREARAFAEELQLILRYTGASHAEMEKGEMRIEANISLHLPNTPYGTKVEVKNINSFKAVEKAIEYEMERQSKVLNSGEKVVQETRGWDDEKEITVSQRIKEEASDYRYFPEPDLPPLQFTRDGIEDIAKDLTELPHAKEKRFIEEFGIEENIARILISDKKLSAFFEAAVSELLEWLNEKNIPNTEKKRGMQLLVNYLTTDIQSYLNETKTPIDEMRITPENFAELITFLLEKKITTPSAKGVLKEMFQTGKEPDEIVREQGLEISKDTGEVEGVIKRVLEGNAHVVADYKSGKTNALQYLIGQAMRELRGRADPDTLKELFLKQLS